MKKTLTRLISFFILASVLATPVLASLPSEPNTVRSASSEPEPAAIREALKDFKNLSRHERKSRIKEAKKAIKQYKADKKAGKAEDPQVSTVLLVILAIILPPLAVYLHQGEINNKFWISLVLTLLFFVPGVIYALLVVLNAI
ncbi:MAG: YqaE/Pmp3 family membrane protein [Chitinophagaceae bacterium]